MRGVGADFDEGDGAGSGGDLALELLADSGDELGVRSCVSLGTRNGASGQRTW